ncbi:hypothetical protein K431DRAFT_1995 [Polychaeton citri CBS 116435]|uniref:Uncharacterized protein n=1 Tax=Polychaeton citri CBS 116435 TaxID=1314669 RepID=A0A9P4UUT0_9PEZI|nr:hypothetical protein K431DRAFT_1995 [Polychaeton citri CBS 116435]
MPGPNQQDMAFGLAMFYESFLPDQIEDHKESLLNVEDDIRDCRDVIAAQEKIIEEARKGKNASQQKVAAAEKRIEEQKKLLKDLEKGRKEILDDIKDNEDQIKEYRKGNYWRTLGGSSQNWSLPTLRIA